MKNRYLYKNRFGVYCLRFSILTKAKQGHFQLQFSLKTKEYALAFERYCAVMPSASSMLAEFRINKHMNDSEITQLKDTLKEMIEKVVEAKTDPSIVKWMAPIRQRRLDNKVDDVFKSTEQLEEKVQRLELELRLSKDKENTLLSALATGASANPSSTPKPTNSRSLGELIDGYCAYKESTWGDRTTKQALSNFTRFAEIVGFETMSTSLDSRSIERYFNTLKSLPKNIGKERLKVNLEKADEISAWWAEAAKRSTGTPLSTGGLEKHFSDIRGFLTWLHERHFVDLDYSKHLKVAISKGSKVKETRGMYESLHIKKIFESYIYTNEKRFREMPKSFHFWAPLIATHSGMRISEIACLEVQDITTVDGVLVFSVNDVWKTPALKDEGVSKSKKTSDSIRNIPIAEAVLNAGLVEFIGRKKTGLLFGDLKLSSTKGQGNMVSRWYNEFFVEYANVPRKNDRGTPLAFHSFRHTFVSLLDKTQIDGSPLRRDESYYVTGHSDDSVRAQTYNHGSYSLPYIKKYIDAIDFGFDWKNVSYERFIKRQKYSGV
ncbi:tyrosine-type recombinase/integrase [Alteromonas sp. CI.11.F.A3]|uniref:tyrosine-type recombinase/integrase n=1 Tax=Alteromonas sp. CI.11.F.A3 TaxID=3079555 RepID=UPI002943CFA1|nr:tyrosine-type recombinase/integrase [Alteromonas sp. CI.11.F.A3]WOI39330.1 tyrosine-type recombinase/integrase [Alteromonas sp. CI.11.F.A3]